MIKKIITFILEILCSILLFSLVLIFIISSKVLNKDYILSTLNKNDYYNLLYTDLIEKTESNLIELDLDNETVKSLFDFNKVKQDVNSLIEGIYNNKNIVIDTSSILNKIDSIIDKRFKDNNRIPTEEENKNINELKLNVKNIYESEIMIHKNMIPKIQKIVSLINNIIPVIEIVLIVIIVVLLLVISLINNGVHIVKPLLTSGFLLIFMYILFKSKFMNILLLSDGFNKALIAVFKDIFKSIIIYGIILIILAISLNILFKENIKK